MLTTCRYCHKIHDSTALCKEKKAALNRRKKKLTKAVIFRRTNAWRVLSESIRARDNNLCQLCLRGIEGPKQINYKRLQVHHIISIEQDYNKRQEESNLITLCKKHHDIAEAGEIEQELLLEIVREQIKRKEWVEDTPLLL